MSPKSNPFFSWNTFKEVDRLRETASTTKTEHDNLSPSFRRPKFSRETFKEVDILREITVKRRVEHKFTWFRRSRAIQATACSDVDSDPEAARQSISVGAKREMLPPIANTPFEQGSVSSDSNPEAEGYTTEVQCNSDPPLAAIQSQDRRLIESSKSSEPNQPR